MSSFLSDTDLAAIRATKAGDHNTAVSIYRAPTVSGGKRGALTLASSGVVCRIWAAAQAPRVVQTLPALAMVRYEAVAFFASTDDVRLGDEVRSGTTRYEVVGLGAWRTALVAALALVVTV